MAGGRPGRDSGTAGDASLNKPARMSRAEIDALVTGLGDMLAVLRDADPADKNESYLRLGLKLTYCP